MGSSINLSSILSSLSSSSGINVASAVAQQIAAESGPMTQWQQQQATLQSQTSVINSIENDIARLQNSLNALSDPVGALTSMAATSSDTTIVNASALSNTAAGNHLVVVDNLATAASWYSNTVASGSAPLTAGKFTLTVASGAKEITVGSGVNTLDQLVTYINGLNVGVSASVVNDSKGSRLALVGANTGDAADFSMTDGAGLSFTRASKGLDASLTFDGIPMDSANNTVTGAINGLTLNLTGAVPGKQVTVSVAPDSSQVAEAIGNFVSAYNTVIGDVNSQYSVDASHKQGVLAGDFTLSALQSSLLKAISYSSGGGNIATLKSLGISMNSDGTLTLDSSKVSNALQSNFAAVQSFFQGTASNGFASGLDKAMDALVDPIDGAFTVDLHSITAQSKDLQNQIDDFQAYLDTRQAYLTEQYNKADIALQQLPILQAQIDAEFGNSSNSKK